MYNFLDSNPVLEDVSFFSNTAQLGGGMINNNDSILRMTNVRFAGNSADLGGAAYNDLGSRITIMNAVISGNYAEQGAGLYSNMSDLNIDNGSFSGNSASVMGGVLYNKDSDARFNNSILWDNQSNGVTGTADAPAVNDGGVTTYTYSLAQGSGGSSGWLWGAGNVDGSGNMDEDPKYLQPVDPSSAPTTSGDLDIPLSSPAVEAGRNSLVDVPYDIVYKQRIVDGDLDGIPFVDMGAYEHYPYGIYVPVILHQE